MSASPGVLFERTGRLGRIVLDRPGALNALTREMAVEIDRVLAGWALDPGIGAVVVTGAARDDGKVPFCAGGDVRAIYEGRRDPGIAVAKSFYWNEYRLDRRVFHFPKPYLALIDGVVMGGGVGVSVHGAFRVMTERALFAMPETGIGLFPDVGGTYFLPRCPGSIGMYLALTGARLKWADALYAGIATHTVPSARLAELAGALAEADLAGDARAALARVLEAFACDPGRAPLAPLRARIDALFAQSSVEWIIRALEAETDDWAARQLANLRRKSPTSLKVTFRQMMLGGALDFDDALRVEYRLALRFARGHDFYEGIRAVIVDKDNAPRWRPAQLEEVSESDVEAYFAPLDEGELEFD